MIKNTIAFSFLGDGIPIAYAGQEQRYTGADDPYNREAIWLSGYSETSDFYRFFASLNQVRNVAIAVEQNYLTYKALIIHSDSSVIAMRKGEQNPMTIVVNNQGSGGGSYTLSLGNTGYTSGEAVVEILSCTTVIVDSDGNLPVPMNQGAPKVRRAVRFVWKSWLIQQCRSFIRLMHCLAMAFAEIERGSHMLLHSCTAEYVV